MKILKVILGILVAFSLTSPLLAEDRISEEQLNLIITNSTAESSDLVTELINKYPDSVNEIIASVMERETQSILKYVEDSMDTSVEDQASIIASASIESVMSLAHRVTNLVIEKGANVDEFTEAGLLVGIDPIRMSEVLNSDISDQSTVLPKSIDNVNQQLESVYNALDAAMESQPESSVVLGVTGTKSALDLADSILFLVINNEPTAAGPSQFNLGPKVPNTRTPVSQS